MRVRGALLREVGRPLEIVSLELDPPGHGELLVRVGAAGLCHSDLSVIDGSRPRPTPMVLGHEAAGEVVEVGDGVEAFVPGDRVVMCFMPACGSCEPCAIDRPALCERGAAANAAGTLLSGERRWLLDDGTRPHHHLGVSAFADHVVVAEQSAVKVDPELPPEIAALFGCAVLTGVGAVINSARLGPGQSVAIFGLGGVGLAALLAARMVRARCIVAVDVVEEKLALASDLGATHAIRGGDDAVSKVLEASGGGVEKAIETAGSATVLEQAYRCTRRGGTTISVGLPDPAQQLSIPAVSLVAEERTLKGSYLGSAVPRRDIPRYIDLYRQDRLPVERLLTHKLALEDINDGFERLSQGVGVRQAVVFDLGP